MGEKYSFKRLDWKHGKMLICPVCLEALFRSDIEHFHRCPYCNRVIELNPQVEEFLSRPTVNGWIANALLSYSLDFPMPH